MLSFLRYPGGKSKVADLILSYMPTDTLEYREPFVGGGGVYFALNPKLVKTRWINDINVDLISVYEAFANRSDEFIKKCREIAPQRMGEEEISTKGTGKKYNKRLGEVFAKFARDEEMDQALRYFFINRTVWGGRVNYEMESRLYYSNPTGWNIVSRPNFLENISRHVLGTKITSVDYENLLFASGEKVWIYLDPPYVVDTSFSSGSKLYQYSFSHEEHLRFVRACTASKHRITISYDDHPQVREWFKDFNINEHEWVYSGSSQSNKKVGKELIITNYPVVRVPPARKSLVEF